MKQDPGYHHALRRICGVAALSTVFYFTMILASRGWDHLSETFSVYGACVTYYEDAHFEQPVAKEVQMRMFRDFRGSPPPLAADSYLAARWEADLWVTSPDLYSFYSESENGIRFWIDGRLVIDNWHPVDWRGSGMHGQIELEQGLHRLKLEHFSVNGNGAVRLKWTGGDIPKNTVIAAPFLRKSGVPYL